MAWKIRINDTTKKKLYSMLQFPHTWPVLSPRDAPSILYVSSWAKQTALCISNKHPKYRETEIFLTYLCRFHKVIQNEIHTCTHIYVSCIPRNIVWVDLQFEKQAVSGGPGPKYIASHKSFCNCVRTVLQCDKSRKASYIKHFTGRFTHSMPCPCRSPCYAMSLRV